MAGYFVLALWFLLVDGVFSADVVKSVSVMEGEPVTLNTDFKRLQHYRILWFFNDTLIALINEDPSTSCLYDGEGGRFRDRLKVDYESGSLNITDIRFEHTGLYEAYLIRSKTKGTSQSLNRTSKCDSTKITRKNIDSTDDDIIKSFSVTVIIPDETNKGFYEKRKEQQSDTSSGPSSSVPGSGPSSSVPGSGLSSGAVAGISVGVLLVFVAAAAGVICYRRRRSRNGL